MTKKEFDALKPGDLIKSKDTGLVFAIQRKIEGPSRETLLLLALKLFSSDPKVWDAFDAASGPIIEAEAPLQEAAKQKEDECQKSKT